MRNWTGLLFGVLIAFGLQAADKISIKEEYTEKAVPFTLGGGVVKYTKESTASFLLTAAVTLEGLADFEVDEFTEMGFHILRLDGDQMALSVSDTVDGATQQSANRWTWIFGYEDIDTEKFIETERMDFTRKGDLLQLSYTSKESSPTYAAMHLKTNGVFRGQADFSLTFGDYEVPAAIFYQGTNTLKTNTFGTGTNQQTLVLASARLSGQVDFTPPEVSISSPRLNTRWESNRVNVVIKATDSTGIQSVKVRAPGVGQEIAAAPDPSPSNLWHAEVDLLPGTNLIQVQCLDLAGNEKTAETRVVYVVKAPIQLVMGPAGAGTVSGIIDGQLLELGRSYTATAKPATGYVFAGWSGSLESSVAALTFSMEEGLILEAQFVPNPFKSLAGTFYGLFHPAQTGIAAAGELKQASARAPLGLLSGLEDLPAPAATNSGMIILTLTDKGMASGKLLIAGKTYSFSAVQFSGNGVGHVMVTRKTPLPPIELNLQLALGQLNGLLQGHVSDGQWDSTLTALLTRPKTSLAGAYTFIIPGGESLTAATEDLPAQVPDGDGAGRVTIDSKGMAKLTGNLGDGTTISASGGISSEGLWPIYLPLQQGKGLGLGWVSLLVNAANPSQITIDGTRIFWIKAPATTGKEPYYPAGFALNARLTGARYQAPSRGQPLMNWTNGWFMASGGNLAEILQVPVGVTNNRLTLASNTNRLTLTLTTTSGLLSGSFRHPITQKTSTYKGALVQWPGSGYEAGGWFRGTNQSGHIYLGPKGL